MKKHSFFYNYNANKPNGYSKFNYGIMAVESDDDDVIGFALDKLKSNAREQHPGADINITAFNRV
jgi:hypothetical protein